MDVLTAAGLTAAAGLAGGVNAIAGGGSLISFPALLAAGYSGKAANVTNTVSVWPGAVAGSFAYRDELRARRQRLLLLLPATLAGSAVGSVILLTTSQSTFDAIVPFLILFACALLTLQGPLIKLTRSHSDERAADHSRVPPVLYASTFMVAVYGAYFGAGIGILLLAVFGILIADDDIQHHNALKGVLALIMNFVAALIFAVFGPVAWGAAVVMAGGSIVGGYCGAAVARRLNPRLLRTAVVIYGVVVALVLLGR